MEIWTALSKEFLTQFNVPYLGGSIIPWNYETHKFSARIKKLYNKDVQTSLRITAKNTYHNLLTPEEKILLGIET